MPNVVYESEKSETWPRRMATVNGGYLAGSAPVATASVIGGGVAARTGYTNFHDRTGPAALSRTLRESMMSPEEVVPALSDFLSRFCKMNDCGPTGSLAEPTAAVAASPSSFPPSSRADPPPSSGIDERKEQFTRTAAGAGANGTRVGSSRYVSRFVSSRLVSRREGAKVDPRGALMIRDRQRNSHIALSYPILSYPILSYPIRPTDDKQRQQ